MQTPASSLISHFSSVAPTEEKKEEGFFDNLSPLYAIPTGIILGIPIIQNEVLILNEESQLVACFAAFVITAYTKGGDAIAASLDAKADAIQAEHNLIEDANIEAVQAVIDGHKKRLTLAKDLADIDAASSAILKTASVASSNKFRHAFRDMVDTRLSQIATKEKNMLDKAGKELAENATATVRAQFSASKEAKGEALVNAIAVLQGKANKSDPVQGLFSRYFKNYSAEKTKALSQELTIPADVLATVKNDIEALAKREGLEDSFAKVVWRNKLAPQ